MLTFVTACVPAQEHPITVVLHFIRRHVLETGEPGVAVSHEKKLMVETTFG